MGSERILSQTLVFDFLPFADLVELLAWTSRTSEGERQNKLFNSAFQAVLDVCCAVAPASVDAPAATDIHLIGWAWCLPLFSQSPKRKRWIWSICLPFTDSSSLPLHLDNAVESTSRAFTTCIYYTMHSSCSPLIIPWRFFTHVCDGASLLHCFMLHVRPMVGVLD